MWDFIPMVQSPVLHYIRAGYHEECENTFVPILESVLIFYLKVQIQLTYQRLAANVRSN